MKMETIRFTTKYIKDKKVRDLAILSIIKPLAELEKENRIKDETKN